MRTRTAVLACGVSLLFGMGIHALTEDPPPPGPIFGFTKYEKVPVKVEVTRDVPVVPDECKDLVEVILRFHKTAREYSEVDAKADILLERMRGAVASRDVKLLDRLTREYDTLLVTSLGNDPTTGKKGAGKSLFELTKAIEDLTPHCDSSGG